MFGRLNARPPASLCPLLLQRDSNLVAVTCDDFVVRVVDVAARRLVRRLAGHANRVLDVAFSPDGRWLVSASLDRSLRVWDLPTGRCIDWLAFDAAPTAVAWAPTGEYLATAHVGSVGLALWASRSHFGGVVLEDAAPAAPVAVDLPAARATEGGDDGDVEGAEAVAPASTADSLAPEPATAVGESVDPATAPAPKEGCRVTLSGVPASAWVHLSKLDLIAQRNKPVMPPSKPAAAPFFLPTASGLTPSFVVGTAPPAALTGGTDALEDDESSGDEGGVKGSGSRGSKLVRREGGGVSHQSPVADALRACAAAEAEMRSDDEEVDARLLAAASDALSDLLASMAPGALNAELRSLCSGPDDEEGVALLGAALSFFDRELAAGRRRFELCHAHLNLLLLAHQGTIGAVPALATLCGRVASSARGDATRLQGLLDRALSVVLGILDAA